METVLKKRRVGKDEVAQTVCAAARRKRRGRRKREEEKEVTAAAAAALPGGEIKTEGCRGERSEAEE